MQHLTISLDDFISYNLGVERMNKNSNLSAFRVPTIEMIKETVSGLQFKMHFTWLFCRNQNETLPSSKIMQKSSPICCFSCSCLLPVPITEYIKSEVNDKKPLKLLSETGQNLKVLKVVARREGDLYFTQQF